MPFLGHMPELIIVVVLALLIFGPKRLPDMANSVGVAIKEFRKTMSEVTESRTPAQTTPQITPVPTAAPLLAETPIVEAETHNHTV